MNRKELEALGPFERALKLGELGHEERGRLLDAGLAGSADRAIAAGLAALLTELEPADRDALEAAAAGDGLVYRQIMAALRREAATRIAVRERRIPYEGRPPGTIVRERLAAACFE